MWRANISAKKYMQSRRGNCKGPEAEHAKKKQAHCGGEHTALTYLLSYLEPVCCSMSSSNCCILTCIHISQEAGQVVWYSHLLKNFPQFVVIHKVKGFGIVNKAEVHVFLEPFCFSMIQQMLVIWSLAPLPFLKPAWTSGSSWFTYHWSPCLKNFEHYFVSGWDECNCAVVWTFFDIAFGIRMKTDIFQSYGHCWVFQIC